MDYDPVSFLTQAWNTFTKGKTAIGPITMLAEADLFEALAAHTLTMDRLSAFEQSPEPLSACFRSARVYKLASRGWRVRFLVSAIAQDFAAPVYEGR